MSDKSEGRYQEECADPTAPGPADQPELTVSDVRRLLDAEHRERRLVWTTKDGRKIPVKEMTDEHVVNTIRMLRRKGGVTMDEFAMMLAGSSSVGGEMAQDALESEISRARVLPPVFDELLEEAARRALAENDAELDGEAPK